MRELLCDYYDGALSRRAFFSRLVAAGLTAAAARSVVEAAETAQASAPGTRRAVSGTGGELLAEQIRAAGTRFVFTNPGSLEVGFFDALVDRTDLHVILGLHEGLVVAMADGFHKVSRQPAFVNVHAIVGTAQMAGQMCNAHRDGSALVVTAGLRDATVYSDDVALGPAQGFSQADVNRQFTKVSWEVRTAESVALALRRAYKVAATSPGGPVYLAVAQAALEQQVTADIAPREAFLLPVAVRPAREQVEALARLLVEAERPFVLLGDEVWKAGAASEAVTLCERLGLPMAAPAFSAFQYLSSAHPQYVGTGYVASKPYPFGSADLLVQLGTRDPGGAVLPREPWIGPGTRFVAVGLDTAMMGRTQPLDLAVVGDVNATLQDLIAALEGLVTSARLARLRDERLARITPATTAARAARRAQAEQHFAAEPIHPDRLGWELEHGVEPNAIIVTENPPGLMGKHDFLRFGPRPDDKLGVSHSGSALGWGVGAAIGAKLAAPDRQVVLSIGDGSVMYSAAGFWSMARYEVPVLTIVWNNRNYQTVRNAGFRYGRRMAATGRYPAVYLGDPDIDFVKLAESQGVRGERVTSPGVIAAALRRGTEATRRGEPYLLEFVVARVGGGADSTWYGRFSAAREQAARRANASGPGSR